RIAHQNVGLFAAHDGLAHLQTNRLQNVALLSVRIVDQSNSRRTVGIVFNGGDAARNSGFVALEIDQAQFSFMPAPMVANRQIAGVAASARALANRRQRLIGAIGRQVIIDHRGGETQARSYRSVCLDRHRLFSFLTSVSTCETGATFKSFFAYWMLGAPSWTCSLRLGWDSLNPAPNRHR